MEKSNTQTLFCFQEQLVKLRELTTCNKHHWKQAKCERAHLDVGTFNKTPLLVFFNLFSKQKIEHNKGRKLNPNIAFKITFVSRSLEHCLHG